MLFRPSVALAIIAKVPHPKQCKTRLVPPLTHDQAAALSACFLADTAANVRSVAARCDATPAVLLTGVCACEDRDAIFGPGMSYVEQRGLTFGERIGTGAIDFLDAGHSGVAIIDSDSPTLPAAFLEKTARALALPGDRVVLGPSADGGYYLIGLNRAHPELFADIDWSTDRVLRQTIERARAIRLETVMLDLWYDVDDAISLEALRRELDFGVPRGGFFAPRSRAYVASLFAQTHTAVIA